MAAGPVAPLPAQEKSEEDAALQKVEPHPLSPHFLVLSQSGQQTSADLTRRTGGMLDGVMAVLGNTRSVQLV